MEHRHRYHQYHQCQGVRKDPNYSHEGQHYCQLDFCSQLECCPWLKFEAHRFRRVRLTHRRHHDKVVPRMAAHRNRGGLTGLVNGANVVVSTTQSLLNHSVSGLGWGLGRGHMLGFLAQSEGFDNTWYIRADDELRLWENIDKYAEMLHLFAPHVHTSCPRAYCSQNNFQ